MTHRGPFQPLPLCDSVILLARCLLLFDSKKHSDSQTPIWLNLTWGLGRVCGHSPCRVAGVLHALTSFLPLSQTGINLPGFALRLAGFQLGFQEEQQETPQCAGSRRIPLHHGGFGIYKSEIKATVSRELASQERMNVHINV